MTSKNCLAGYFSQGDCQREYLQLNVFSKCEVYTPKSKSFSVTAHKATT